VVTALRTGFVVILELFAVDELVAASALYPEVARALSMTVEDVLDHAPIMRSLAESSKANSNCGQIACP
jgi:hypothetical protein